MIRLKAPVPRGRGHRICKFGSGHFGAEGKKHADRWTDGWINGRTDRVAS